MKKTLLTLVGTLTFLAAAYGLAGATASNNPPHTDYRPGYGTSCAAGNAACHTVSQGTFLPETLTTSDSANWANFCASCHNSGGEAHDKSVGSASTVQYNNVTGGLVSGSYSGNSHSWNGSIKAGGTRVPTAAGYNGVFYMPGNKVVCTTCHKGVQKIVGIQNIDWIQATDSGDHINYTILGYSTTDQHLSQYVKVYRAAATTARPTNSRTKKDYLVSPAEYSYDYTTAKVTFTAAQSAASVIYVDIPQPYYRVDNKANAACFDCHLDRVDTAASHAPGTGVKDGHPVNLTYGKNFGLNNTLKPSASSAVYLEGGKVICTSCHDVHNSASKEGNALREADGSTLCTDCHKTRFDGYSSSDSVNNHFGAKHATATVCLECHTTHGSNNIMLIRNTINGKTINFQNFSGANSFSNGSGNGVCAACHMATNYHKADGTGASHNANLNCTQCHSHASGFKPNGDCTSCHDLTSDKIPSGWVDAGDHKSHLARGAACTDCHPAVSGAHPEGLASAKIILSGWSDGGTTGKISTNDDTCTNIGCHSGTRTWKTASGCDGCHSYPGSATNPWTAGNGHLVTDDVFAAHMMGTGYNAATDTYAAMVADPTRCGKCHPNVPSNHQNGTVNVAGNGLSACGGGNFTISVTASGSNVTCNNVRCHGAGKTTPNWY
ncbi:MAG TPA: cytochrome c3 family protein [Nitrospirota bacterium]|jgi:predicted CXXCH cytochrome family protein